MTRLRVLITPEWYPWPDQPMFGVFCREQARVVASLHDVVVLTWRCDERIPKPFAISEAREDGLLTFRVRFRSSPIPKLGSICKMLGVALVMQRLRRRAGWKPDIVHAHEYQAGAPALVIGKLTGAPVVISEHASAFARGRVEPRQLALAEQVFRRADVISPVSRDLSLRLADLVGGTRLFPVPNAVETTMFRPGSSPDWSQGVRLLTVGNLVEIKGHRHLIDALGRLHALGTDARLDIVGDGELRSELEERVDRLGLESSVRFHGVLSKQGVAEAMRAADIFVLPSLWENMPCVLAEAMASGLPSVASRVGGIPEVIDHRVGLMVEPGSSEALAAALDEIIHSLGGYDPRILRQMAIERYGHKAVCHQWTQVYELAKNLGSSSGMS
jgi:glycosyltransferase involved in cell wall biosynthesis